MECPFDLTNSKAVNEFDEIDPYNPQNTLNGFVNRRQGELYGALWITHVNGEECEQLIYSVPKQHYPFDKDRNWIFPEFDTIHIFEKLDGTCIISYVYKDYDGDVYLTYKTRLRPFLGSSKFGDFKSLWDEMREEYPDIDALCFKETTNYIFELYGKRNKILIDYDTPLDTKLLFAISTSDGEILSPYNFRFEEEVPVIKCENVVYEIDGEKYTKIQNQLEEGLFIDEPNKIMKGKEGYVMYFLRARKCVQIKNKPPSVLKYHWAGDAIAYESIFTTVYNAFENYDEPTYENVCELLTEEFDEGKIEKSKRRIEKILGKVLFEKKFQHTLSVDYKRLGFDFNKNKVEVMRWFGENYPKSEAHRIYNLLRKYEEGK